MKNVKKINNKDIIKIGYITPLDDASFLAVAKQHLLFENKRCKFVKCQYATDLKDGLERKKFDYIISPCRSSENEVSPIMLDIISSMVNRSCVEIGTFYLKQKYSKKIRRIQNAEFTDKDVKETFDRSEYEFCVDGSEEDYFDYKIFHRSAYKVGFFQRLFTLLFANAVLSKVSVALLIVVPLVLVLLGNTIGEQAEFIITTAVTFVVGLFQFINYLLNINNKAKVNLFKGYWLYYSFEERKDGSSFVPKGFKTRILKIEENDGQLNISCKMSGEDNLFFNTTNTAFEFNTKNKVGSGFYEYVTNTRNNKGKRAEGICRFRGESEGYAPILTMDGWFSSRGTEINGRVKYVRISKEEYELLSKSNNFYANQFKKSNSLEVGVYGDEGSNTEEASKRWLETSKHPLLEGLTPSDIIFCYYESLEMMHKDLLSGKIDICFVPEINRNIPIKSNQMFNKDKGLKRIDLFDMEIKYVLGSTKNNFKLKEDTLFISHPESIKQCAKFINHRPTSVESSSSRAARELKYFSNGRNVVAIINENALNFYHLYPVLDEEGKMINPYIEEEINITKFAVYIK